MEFRIIVTVDRESGKFVSRDEIADRLVEEIEQIPLDSMGADGDSVYYVTNIDLQSHYNGPTPGAKGQ